MTWFDILSTIDAIGDEKLSTLNLWKITVVVFFLCWPHVASYYADKN